MQETARAVLRLREFSKSAKGAARTNIPCKKPIAPHSVLREFSKRSAAVAFLVVCAAGTLLWLCAPRAIAAGGENHGKTRVYYVAADEVNWDYAPSGRDEAMGMEFDPIAKGYAESGPHQIGRINKKAVYREYTDATFTKLKPRLAEDAYLGILGPIFHAEAGDTFRVVFRNNATHPFSMHPHGVLYEKDSEGAGYNDNTGGKDTEDGCVAPGATHAYTWQIPERAGPGPADPSSIFWLYHSHCDELRDVASGPLWRLCGDPPRRGDTRWPPQ